MIEQAGRKTGMVDMDGSGLAGEHVRLPAELDSPWPGMPASHEGQCPAATALALLAQGVDRLRAVRWADFALDDKRCGSHPRCLWRAVTVLLCSGDLIHADAQIRKLESTCTGLSGDLIVLLRSQYARLVGDPTEGRKIIKAVLAAEPSAFIRQLAIPFLVATYVATDDAEEAYALLSEVNFDEIIADSTFTLPLNLVVRGSVYLALANYDSGPDELRLERLKQATVDLLESMHYPGAELSANFAVMHRCGLAALAAARVGLGELASGLAEQEKASAMAWGSPSAVGWALFVCAMTENSSATVDALADAVDLLEVAYSRVELAAAGYQAGLKSADAKDGSSARRDFERVVEWAEKTGNATLIKKAKDALSGATSSGLAHQLTAQEGKIAQLARTGYTNKQIAEKLCLTIRTVEFHLSNVYRKLGVSGRRELKNAKAYDSL
ncbi:hypothetical protein SD37_09540 [Amycolatopsis orientalis]|uniref:HTH luxR-type domain-containing protein n=1 Tax=Amycolatopsis orientalis TaxID=31958 RepID=A0A193BUK7_AMYOR|nr:LuxR family transcriptional regulator [Amycolatopsis orientalis]ANN15863.1 hypothetical protein SD37_09540 [Amycolatopsis orientalis]